MAATIEKPSFNLRSLGNVTFETLWAVGCSILASILMLGMGAVSPSLSSPKRIFYWMNDQAIFSTLNG